MSKVKANSAGGRNKPAPKQKKTRQGNGLRSVAKPGRKKRRGQGR